MKKHRLSETAKVIIIVCGLFVAANVILGSVLLSRSKALAPGDEGTPEYRKIYDSLRLF
ncbi:MAG: hypothetical protein J5449_05125 [Oscillospiraceae bacterium]|nr:hypothetical protein [Oscillospiraceae bacterium]